jgi:hypothetical protein
MAWTWRFESADGGPVHQASVPEHSRVSFPSQADAESWLGENWRELLDVGVAQVTLLDGDREVYGPMGLESPG